MSVEGDKAEPRKGERGGLVPVMKGFDALKKEFAELKERFEEMEKQLAGTSGKVEGVLAGALVECSECESLIQAEKYPKHWMKMHAPEPPEISHAKMMEIFDNAVREYCNKRQPKELDLNNPSQLTQIVGQLLHECEKAGMCKAGK